MPALAGVVRVRIAPAVSRPPAVDGQGRGGAIYEAVCDHVRLLEVGAPAFAVDQRLSRLGVDVQRLSVFGLA